MSAPLVSVIIPCYNQGAFLGEAVESVLAQTAGNFEILIVDDGSTDGHTGEVLDRARWPHTQIFRTENRGVASARNYLLERAHGSFVCALDADDRLHAEYFARTLAEFARDPSVSFVASRLQMFGEENRITPDELDCDLVTLLCDCPVFSAALVRTQSVRSVGGFDARFNAGNEDWDLWITLLEAGHRGVILPDILFYYRRRVGSLCDQCTRPDTLLAHLRRLFDKHIATYTRHRGAVIERKARTFAALERTTQSVKDEIAGLQAAIQSLESPRCLDTTVATRSGELDDLHREYSRAMAEITALHESLSWRLTAPLRALYDRLTPTPRHMPAALPDAPSRHDGTDCETPVARANDSSETGVLEVLLREEARLLQCRQQLDSLRSVVPELRARLDQLQCREPDPAPVARVAVALGDLRRTSPISQVWGTDRGRPIDRYYIEDFLDRHRQAIKGCVLEIKDSTYARRFGGDAVNRTEVLDIDPTNPLATISADLAGRAGIGTACYDCCILTQTLGLIYDVRSALTNAAAALKPGGVLLCTLPASGRISYEGPGLDGDYWRFTAASTRRLFADVFPMDSFTVTAYGNVLARAAFLYGLADHELARDELDAHDPYFPVIYAVRAVRTWR